MTGEWGTAMISLFKDLTVINGTTETGWADMVRDGMKQRRAVLLLLADPDEESKARLEALGREHGYEQPDPPSEAEWAEWKDKLNLSGYAAKEQGINRNFAYLLRPGRIDE